LVLNRLARLASIAEPENVKRNFKELRKQDRTLSFEEVQDRALFLERMFYPEMLALFSMRQKYGIDLFTLRGSSAGAFGIPQFLPSSYLRFGVDGNEDGEISLYDIEDAAYSAANFLSGFGWKLDLSAAEKREVLWNY